jgi:2-polyprenyl-6-methoxyphenol hydroxylase-like FAD-dependent oxidoreductase
VSLLVGADGIYSRVYNLLNKKDIINKAFCDELPSINSYVDEKANISLSMNLQYLGLMVILGISPIFSNEQNQWVDGETRVFSMPFDKRRTMWQLSFPLNESDAIRLTYPLSKHIADERMKMTALNRCNGWSEHLLKLISRTNISDISGHPVYDRNPIEKISDSISTSFKCVTLIGDAAHPMSPFKGQGANQALIDALDLSQILSHLSDSSSPSINLRFTIYFLL